MSFNFIFDMIERSKECLAPLKLRRERSKDAINERLTRRGHSKQANISLEKIESIIKESKEWEEKEQQMFFKSRLLFLGMIVIIILILAGIFIFIFQ